jgi:biofilm PGA synthesis protein PgaD
MEGVMLDYKKIIIEKPQSLPKAVTWRDRVLTFLFWGIFIYLFRPLVALVLWFAFGYHIFNPEVFSIAFYEDVLEIIVKNFFVIAFLVVLFFSWALYNIVTFGHLRRRKGVRQVADEEIANYFGLEMETLNRIRTAKFIRLSLAKGLRILSLK